jgi:hypothetical protein
MTVLPATRHRAGIEGLAADRITPNGAAVGYRGGIERLALRGGAPRQARRA